jgi:hypothetical protein
MFAPFHCIANRASTIRRIDPAGTALSSSIQRRPKAARARRGSQSGHVVDANWLETSPKPLKLSSRIPVLYAGMCALEHHASGPEPAEIVLRWLTRQFSD